MPKVLTDAYKNASFCLPFTEDKSECAWVRPITETDLNKIRQDAAKEGGADENLTNRYFIRSLLQKSITDWQGFYDVMGNALDCNAETIRDICECDPEFAALMALRIRNIARIGEIEERKN